MANLDVQRNTVFIKFAQYFTYYPLHGAHCTKLYAKHQQYWIIFYTNISFFHFQEIIIYCYVITIGIAVESIIHVLQLANHPI